MLYSSNVAISRLPGAGPAWLLLQDLGYTVLVDPKGMS